MGCGFTDKKSVEMEPKMMLAFVLVVVIAKAIATSNTTKEEETSKILLQKIKENDMEKVLEPGKNVSALLNGILAQYDSKIRPYYGVKPVDLSIDMIVLSFGKIQEADMMYTVDIFLGQLWYDPRFSLGMDQYLTLGGLYVQRIWLPDTFFVNSIKTTIHQEILPDQKVWIDLKNGRVLLSSRVRTTASCKMDLRNYPMDQQACVLVFESYTYDQAELIMKWNKNSTGQSILLYDPEMAQFTVMSARKEGKHSYYNSPSFAGATARFLFQRRTKYYVFQTFIPSTCIVCLSWLGFWISHDATPARISLCITTVLTIITMLAAVNAGMPRVSYLKAIDYFLLVSFCFIFLTLFEYVLALRVARNRKMKASRRADKKKSDEEQHMETANILMSLNVDGKTYILNPVQDEERVNSSFSMDGFRMTNNGASGIKGRSRFSSIRKTAKGLKKKLKMRIGDKEGENIVDIYARVVFPLIYLIFNAVYWVYYLNFAGGIDTEQDIRTLHD